MNVASFDELQDKYRLVFLAMPRTQTLHCDATGYLQAPLQLTLEATLRKLIPCRCQFLPGVASSLRNSPTAQCGPFKFNAFRLSDFLFHLFIAVHVKIDFLPSVP